MKRLITCIFAMVMSLGAVTVASAEEITPYISNFEGEAQEPGFYSVSGVIIEVAMDRQQIYVEKDDGGKCYFNFMDETYFISGEKNNIVVGDEVTGYYDANSPMILIEPPQYTASAVAVNHNFNDLPAIKVDRFDENGLSWDEELKLNISDKTEIILYDGTIYDGDLTNKGLVAFYSIATRSIPPQTPPDKIVVLVERIPNMTDEQPTDIVEGDGAIILDDGTTTNAELYTPEINEIVVEGIIIDAPRPYYSAGVLMLPLRAVAEALGYDVVWDNETKIVLLDGGRLSLTVGKDIYDNASYSVGSIAIGAAPENIDGTVYAPIRFFTSVAGLNNAYSFEGQAIIGNLEKFD